MIIINTLNSYFLFQIRHRRGYWSDSPDIHNSAVARAMTRNRFEKIMQYFYLYDPDDVLDPQDKCRKVRPLATMLNERY